MDEIFSNGPRPASITAFLLATVLVVLIMVNGSTILVPIVVAIGIWLVLNNVADLIHRWKFGRFQLPRPVAMAVGMLFILLLGMRVTGLFVRNTRHFMRELPVYTENLNSLLNTIPDTVWKILLGEDAALSTDIVEHLFIYAADFFTAYLSTVAAQTANFASNAVYIAVYVIFLLLEQGTFAAKTRYMFSDPTRRTEFQTIMQSIREQVQTYITVKTAVSFITGLVSYGIMLLFQLEHAIIWALLIFVLNFIPNIGSIIAVAFPAIMGLLQFGNFATVSTLIIVLGLVQVAVGYFVEPRMMGNQLNISPFVVLVALGVFGAIWGITGMFLSVPLTVMLMIVFSHFDSTRPIAVLLSGDGQVYGVEGTDPASIALSGQ